MNNNINNITKDIITLNNYFISKQKAYASKMITGAILTSVPL